MIYNTLARRIAEQSLVEVKSTAKNSSLKNACHDNWSGIREAFHDIRRTRRYLLCRAFQLSSEGESLGNSEVLKIWISLRLSGKGEKQLG